MVKNGRFKKIGILSILLFLSILFINNVLAAPQNLTTNLTAYYSYDIDARDDSNGTYNGTVYGAEHITSGQKAGAGAYQFNGSTYIRADLNHTPSPYTIGFWTKLDYSYDVSNSSFSFMGSNIGGFNDGDFRMEFNRNSSGEIGIMIDDPDDVKQKIIFSDANNWTADTWYYFVAKSNGSSIFFYVDGVEQNRVFYSNTSTNGIGITGNYTWYFGKDPQDPLYIYGVLDEISFFDRALNDTEISALYNNGMGCNPLTNPTCTNTAPTTPNITYPTNGEFINGSVVPLINITWQASNDSEGNTVYYNLSYGTDNSSWINLTRTMDTYYELDLLSIGSGTYYIKLTADDTVAVSDADTRWFDVYVIKNLTILNSRLWNTTADFINGTDLVGMNTSDNELKVNSGQITTFADKWLLSDNTSYFGTHDMTDVGTIEYAPARFGDALVISSTTEGLCHLSDSVFNKNAGESMSVCTAFQVNQSSGIQIIYGMYDSAAGGRVSLLVQSGSAGADANKLLVDFKQDATYKAVVYSDSAITFNTPHTHCFNWNASNYKLETWVDGVKQTTTATSVGLENVTSNTVFGIGGWNVNGATCSALTQGMVKGYIDDLVIAKRMVTEEEILEYNNTATFGVNRQADLSDLQGWVPQSGNAILNMSILLRTATDADVLLMYSDDNATWQPHANLTVNGTNLVTLFAMGEDEPIYYRLQLNKDGSETPIIYSYTIYEGTTPIVYPLNGELFYPLNKHFFDYYGTQDGDNIGTPFFVQSGGDYAYRGDATGNNYLCLPAKNTPPSMNFTYGNWSITARFNCSAPGGWKSVVSNRNDVGPGGATGFTIRITPAGKARCDYYGSVADVATVSNSDICDGSMVTVSCIRGGNINYMIIDGVNQSDVDVTDIGNLSRQSDFVVGGFSQLDVNCTGVTYNPLLNDSIVEWVHFANFTITGEQQTNLGNCSFLNCVYYNKQPPTKPVLTYPINTEEVPIGVVGVVWDGSYDFNSTTTYYNLSYGVVHGDITSDLRYAYYFNNNTLDMSGNGYDLTNNGATAVPGVQGVNNTAYQFNFSDSDYMNHSTAPGIGGDILSIAAVYLTHSFNPDTGMIIQERIGQAQYQWRIDGNLGGKDSFWWYNGGWHLNISHYAHNLSQWECNVIVRNGTTLQRYRNGYLYETSPIDATDFDNVSSSGIYVGSTEGIAHFSNMTLDDIRVYNRALADEDVKSYCNLFGMYETNIVWTPLTRTASLTYDWNTSAFDGGIYYLEVVGDDGNLASDTNTSTLQLIEGCPGDYYNSSNPLPSGTYTIGEDSCNITQWTLSNNTLIDCQGGRIVDIRTSYVAGEGVINNNANYNNVTVQNCYLLGETGQGGSANSVIKNVPYLYNITVYNWSSTSYIFNIGNDYVYWDNVTAPVSGGIQVAFTNTDANVTILNSEFACCDFTGSAVRLTSRNTSWVSNGLSLMTYSDISNCSSPYTYAIYLKSGWHNISNNTINFHASGGLLVDGNLTRLETDENVKVNVEGVKVSDFAGGGVTFEGNNHNNTEVNVSTNSNVFQNFNLAYPITDSGNGNSYTNINPEYINVTEFIVTDDMIVNTDLTSMVLVLENNEGNINWTIGVDVSTQGDLDSYVQIGNEFIGANSPNLNLPARLTMYDTSYTEVGQFYVLKNGIGCTDCNGAAVTGNNVSFNVVGFSNYTLEGININITPDPAFKNTSLLYCNANIGPLYAVYNYSWYNNDVLLSGQNSSILSNTYFNGGNLINCTTYLATAIPVNYTKTQFDDGTGQNTNITFNGTSKNRTKYISIPQGAIVNNATVDFTGFGSELTYRGRGSSYLIGTDYYFYINYTRDDDGLADITYWQVKHGSSPTYNITVPSGCRGGTTYQGRIYSWCGGPCTSHPECYSSVLGNWTTIGNTYTGGSLIGYNCGGSFICSGSGNNAMNDENYLTPGFGLAPAHCGAGVWQCNYGTNGGEARFFEGGIIASFYPANVTIKANGTTFFSHNDYYYDNNLSVDFTSELQTCVDSYSTCDVYFEVDTVGKVNVDNLFISYSIPNSTGNVSGSISDTIVISDTPPVINSVGITPPYPVSVNPINCTFNVTDVDFGDKLNVSITWFTRNETGGWTNENSYDYTWVNVTRNVNYMTAVGTGSVAPVINNYTYWKCQANLTEYATTLLSSVVYTNIGEGYQYPAHEGINQSNAYDGNLSTYALIADSGTYPDVQFAYYNLSYNNSRYGINPSQINFTVKREGTASYTANVYCIDGPNPQSNVYQIGTINGNDGLGNQTFSITYPNCLQQYSDYVAIVFYHGGPGTKLYEIFDVTQIYNWTNFTVSILANSTNVSLHPLQNLTLISPPNGTFSNQPLNVTYNVIDYDGGIQCQLNIQNSTGGNFTSPVKNTTSGDNTSINYTLVDDDVYTYNVSCTATGDIMPLYSENRVYIFDGHPPVYSLFGDNSTATTPTIGDSINLWVYVSDTYMIDTCKLEMNDTTVWENKSTFFINVSYNYNLTMNYTIQNYSTSNNSNIGWRVWCNDTGGNVNVSEIQSFTVKDTTYPIIFVGGGSSYNTNNLTVISSALYNLSLDMNFYDINLFNASVNITCLNDGQIYYWNTTNISSSSYQLLSTADLDAYDPQICTVFATAGDGVNTANLTNYFYIGGAVNVTGLNIYDNSTITNFVINTTQNTGYPTYNSTSITCISGNCWVANLTNGSYTVDVGHTQFYAFTYNMNIENSTHNLAYDSYNNIINFRVRNVETLEYLTDFNITINNTGTGQVNSFESGNTTWITNYIDNGTYTYNISKEGWLSSNGTFSITYLENRTIVVDLYFLASFNLIDERTLGPFNITPTDEIKFKIFCEEDSIGTLEYNVTAINFSVPVTCNYRYFRFILYYTLADGPFNYYRSLIIDDPSTAVNYSVYLIDISDTSYVVNTFTIEDLLGTYENVSIYVKKRIPGEEAQITADFVDINDKILAYLIENDEYTIEVHSVNQPVRVMGLYVAHETGEKSLRLYDISIRASGDSFDNSVTFGAALQNISGQPYFVAYYNDTVNQTNSVTWNLYQTTYNSTPFYTTTVASSPNIEFIYNATPYVNDTIFSKLSIDHQLGSYDSITLLNEVTRIAAEFLDHVSTNFLNWFILMVLGVLAIYGTIKTANYVSLALVGLAGLFVAFGWLQISSSILGFSLLIALVSVLKEGGGGRK